jgi:hypothetical protein
MMAISGTASESPNTSYWWVNWYSYGFLELFPACLLLALMHPTTKPGASDGSSIYSNDLNPKEASLSISSSPNQQHNVSGAGTISLNPSFSSSPVSTSPWNMIFPKRVTAVDHTTSNVNNPEATSLLKPSQQSNSSIISTTVTGYGTNITNLSHVQPTPADVN